jgi:hypothetical protein
MYEILTGKTAGLPAGGMRRGSKVDAPVPEIRA